MRYSIAKGCDVGTQTFIYGYVETVGGRNEHNARIVERFDFDIGHLFRKVFSEPKIGYINSMVSFADSVKTAESDWSGWLLRFEAFLAELDAISAKVHFENTESSTRGCYSYLFSNGKWMRWRIGIHETEKEERTAPF